MLLDGKPLPTGEIYLRTTETGSLNIVPVKDGRFSGRAAAGKRRVEVNSFREEITPEARAMYGDSASPSRVNTIPETFNSKSTIVADVVPDAVNEFTFEVRSK